MTNTLQEIIQEAVAEYLAELDYKQRLAQVTNKGAKDQISIDKLMLALDGAEKSGKTSVSHGELAQMAKQAIALSAPLGKAAPGSVTPALSPTGGTPLHAPMGAGNVSSPFAQEGKIKVTKSQLKEMVAKVVNERLLEFATNENPIMAKREIIALMDSTSRNFENEIIKTFGLQHPDSLQTDLQRRYLEIVEQMKAELVGAAMKAVRELIHFPKQEKGNG